MKGTVRDGVVTRQRQKSCNNIDIPHAPGGRSAAPACGGAAAFLASIQCLTCGNVPLNIVTFQLTLSLVSFIRTVNWRLMVGIIRLQTNIIHVSI